VEHAIDRHRGAIILVENSIRKSSYQNSTIILVDFCVSFRHPANVLYAGVNATKKIFSQAVPTFLLPVVRLADILLDFRCKDEFNGHIDF
jgi:hypothetical protein